MKFVTPDQLTLEQRVERLRHSLEESNRLTRVMAWISGGGMVLLAVALIAKAAFGVQVCP